MVSGDFGQRQLADNLIANAIRYGCTDKGCRLKIAVRGEDHRVACRSATRAKELRPSTLPRLDRTLLPGRSGAQPGIRRDRPWAGDRKAHRRASSRTLEIQSEPAVNRR